MKKLRWFTLVLGFGMAVMAVTLVLAPRRGLQVTALHGSQPPVMVISPAGADGQPRPLVLVGHGFSGSAVLMQGFGLALAKAGYRVALWDFAGHAANPQPMPVDLRSDALLQDASAVLKILQAESEIDLEQVAILGHSMGSGAALRFGIEHPETAATIAVSPVPQTVTPDLPRNLLLMAGELEPRFVANAQNLLVQAGGPGGSPADGSARLMQVIRGVEHISILFSPAAHQAAVAWVDSVFGVQPGAAAFTDRRVLWYGLGLAGILLAFSSASPLIAEKHPAELKPSRPVWRRISAMLAGVLGATIILWVVDRAGIQTNSLFGLLVGGYLLVWFSLAGLIAWLVLWQSLPALSLRQLLVGLAAGLALWLGFGVLGQLVWLQWWLIPPRLALWPLGVLMLLPWFLALGQITARSGRLGSLGWWLVHSAITFGGLMMAMNLNPGLGFLALILPLLPVILGLHSLAAGSYRGPWPYALSGALFVSWLLLAIFPLQS